MEFEVFRMQTTPRKSPWAQTPRNLQQFIPVPGYKTTLLPGLYVSEIPKTSRKLIYMYIRLPGTFRLKVRK